ncbi:MAG: hypothetical protein QG629_725 [Patescibacteria group bacterium]|nr:hypothetical protein [Candidatus Saccharibacteria bacterium]MDQ5963642.1 hypothetical protein [Patescibacteria group bacterium]
MSFNPFDAEHSVQTSPEIPAGFIAQSVNDGTASVVGETSPAKSASGASLARQIADIYVDMCIGDQQKTVAPFPRCDTIDRLLEAAELIEKSPLGFGHANSNVNKHRLVANQEWSDFFAMTVARWREKQGLGSSQATKISLDLPESKLSLPLFPKVLGLDIAITGDVTGELARGALYSRFIVDGSVQKSAVIGQSATNCGFIIKGDFMADNSGLVPRSFSDATEIDVHIMGTAPTGAIGPVESSKIHCDNPTINSYREVVGMTCWSTGSGNVISGLQTKYR